MIVSAVEARLECLFAQFSETGTGTGHAVGVRNGHHSVCPVQTGNGPVNVSIPELHSKVGKPVSFHSALVPPSLRRPKPLEAALLRLNLKGVSSVEVGAALKVLLGPAAVRTEVCPAKNYHHYYNLEKPEHWSTDL